MTFYQIGWFSSICHLHILESLYHVDVNLKLRFLIKSGYYIVPIPSTALVKLFQTFAQVKQIYLKKDVHTSVSYETIKLVNLKPVKSYTYSQNLIAYMEFISAIW